MPTRTLFADIKALTIKEAIILILSFGWGFIGVAAFAAYLATRLSDYPAAIVGLLSGISSIILGIDVWRFHREKSYLLQQGQLPKADSTIKIILCFIIMIVGIALAIYYGIVRQYANTAWGIIACIFGIIWVFELRYRKKKLESKAQPNTAAEGPTEKITEETTA